MDEYQNTENEDFSTHDKNDNAGIPPPLPENPYEVKKTEQFDVPPMRPTNWLWQSIVVTILCCSPLAIIGIVYATRVNALYDNGQFEEANKSAKTAKLWTLIALVLGLIYMIYVTVKMMNGEVSTEMVPSDSGASIYNY